MFSTIRIISVIDPGQKKSKPNRLNRNKKELTQFVEKNTYLFCAQIVAVWHILNIMGYFCSKSMWNIPYKKRLSKRCSECCHHIGNWNRSRILYMQLGMPLTMIFVMPINCKIITFYTLCQRIICARWITPKGIYKQRLPFMCNKWPRGVMLKAFMPGI